jgi:S-adenosylmethionine hydrolase
MSAVLPSGILTLLTDFGERDGYTGVIKGVIWGMAPGARIADLTHAVAPQNVLQGALILGNSVPYFPAGTVHLAVVDPGVGTQRRPLAACLGGQYFVGPDNGLCTCLVEQAEKRGGAVEAVCLDRPEHWLPGASHTFHGRDIFAPAAARLLQGIPLQELGSPLKEVQRLDLPRPVRVTDGWRAQVVMVDAFGNLATNLTLDDLAGQQVREVRLRGASITGLVQTFGAGTAGDLIALIDSAGCLAVAEVNGDAARRLGCQAGEIVEVLVC